LLTRGGIERRNAGEARELCVGAKSADSGRLADELSGNQRSAALQIEQLGRVACDAERDHRKKSVAQRMIVDALNKEAGKPSKGTTVRGFLEQWPRRFPRHPRTEATNFERIGRYILPHLPREGALPLQDLRRAQLRDVQEALLREGLSKTTIDGASSSLSAILRDAVDDELLDANPAHGFRVRPGDPRLRPKRNPRKPRAVSVDELRAFFGALDVKYLAVGLAPLLTGARLGELFAMNRGDLDRDRELMFLHRTATKYGRVQDGLKTTHHIGDREARGRWTLFPTALRILVDEAPPNISGWLFTAPRGGLWGQRHFYRDVWEPARDTKRHRGHALRLAAYVLIATTRRGDPAARGEQLDGTLATRGRRARQHHDSHVRPRDG
jgi:integrase